MKEAFTCGHSAGRNSERGARLTMDIEVRVRHASLACDGRPVPDCVWKYR